MATLTVGSRKQFSTISAAVAAAKDGDTVQVDAGTYVNDFPVIKTKISLVAVGGQAILLDTAVMGAGKGILTVTTDATVDGFAFEGARATDGSGAGLLYTGGALVVRNSLFLGNQDGLVANACSTGTIVIQGSEFGLNGNEDGFSHNIAVGQVKSLTIQDSYVHDALGGDEIRSRAKATTITGTTIMDNSSDSGVAVNLPNGGVVAIRNSTIVKGSQSTAAALVREGGDVVYAGSSLSVTGTMLATDKAGAVGVQNLAGAAASVSVSGNTLYGLGGNVATGTASVSGNSVTAVHPAMPAGSVVASAAASTAAAGLVAMSEAGRAGAVVASGRVLTVGASGAYSSLAAALAAARDGDTIDVAAGTYSTGSLLIGKKVVIEGVGGMATFAPGAAPANGSAQFVTTTDVTFRNVEITGVATPGGTAAAIRDQAGTLTVVNSFIHDNQAGIVADAGTASRVAVYDSEIARNGTPGGTGANIDVAEIGTLTLRNAWVHDAIAGPEVRSRADNTVVAGTRISQVSGNGAADLELPDGGAVSVTGSVLQKGAAAQGTALVHVGGGSVHAGSSVTLDGNTFISGQAAATRFVAADSGVSGVSVSNGVFVGGAAGSVQGQNAAVTGSRTATGVSVSTAAPWGAAGAPSAGALTVAPSGAAASQGVLVLHVSEDAWRGDAKYTVTVDGQAVGGTLTATASHGAGQSQAVTIAGGFAPGAHSVAVTYVNDQQGGPGQDRNLYVDGVSFNGEDLHQGASLPSNGTALFSTGAVSRATPVVVNLSEDAWRGDAMAFIAIDGKVLGGLQAITASHAAGQTQAMSFVAELTPGAHTASVSFLNAAGSRGLYVDSIDVAGAHYGSAAGAVSGGAASNFTFNVQAPAAANTGLFVTTGLPQAWVAPAPLM